MSKAVPLPMAAPDPPLVACTSCGRCCTYVSVGINEPTKVRYASDILWYLYHESVSVYLDGDGEWSVVFETRCRNLRSDLLCGVYEQRPIVCRDFDNTTCEVNSTGGRTFATPEDFLRWLAGERPAVHRALLARYVPPALKADPPARARLRPRPRPRARAGEASS